MIETIVSQSVRRAEDRVQKLDATAKARPLSDHEVYQKAELQKGIEKGRVSCLTTGTRAGAGPPTFTSGSARPSGTLPRVVCTIDGIKSVLGRAAPP